MGPNLDKYMQGAFKIPSQEHLLKRFRAIEPEEDHARMAKEFWPHLLRKGGTPAPVRVSASLDVAGRERAVEQSGSAFVVCENGMSLFVDVTWHHLGEGERFGVGLRGSKGSAAINPLTVWKELHGMPVDVSPTGSVSRENAFTASYRAEWAHFEAAIAGEAKVASLEEHLVLHRIIDAVYKSAEDGRDVVL